MHAFLTIAGIIIIIAALRRLSKVCTISGVGVVVIFGLGILLARFWSVFLGCVAIALSLFLWWLVIRFLIERLSQKNER
jgi:hypothetical protein